MNRTGGKYALMYLIILGQIQGNFFQKDFVPFRLPKASDGQNCPTEYSEKSSDDFNRINCLLHCSRDSTCRSVFFDSDALTCTKCAAKYVLRGESTTSNVSMFYKPQEAVLAYTVVDEPLSWADAKQNCLDLGGQLSSIKSSEEQTLVENIVKSYLSYGVWIGGYGTAGKASSFKWLDGTFVSSGYQNWHGSGVSNQSGGDCMKMGKIVNYQWKNKNCGDEVSSVCKLEL